MSTGHVTSRVITLHGSSFAHVTSHVTYFPHVTSANIQACDLYKSHVTCHVTLPSASAQLLGTDSLQAAGPGYGGGIQENHETNEGNGGTETKNTVKYLP